MTQTIIPAAHGRAVHLKTGQRLAVINITGSQVVDFWAFTADLTEWLSTEVTRRLLLRLVPRPGDMLFTNHREPLLAFEEDTSPGVHDMLITCCDAWAYKKYGVEGYHRSCYDNHLEATRALGLAVPRVPNPFNLFQNTPVTNNSELDFAPPVARPGDRVVFRALRDAVAVMSACPMDVIPVNGAGNQPTDAAYEVLG